MASTRSPLRKETASGQMHQYHPVGLEATADPQPANSSPITRRRVLPFKGTTIKGTADTNTAAAIGTTSHLPIDPEGDQEADPSPDVEEVTPGTEGAQEALLIHILREGITQAEGPDHNPDPDLGLGPGLTEEGQGLVNRQSRSKSRSRSRSQGRRSHHSRSCDGSRSPDCKHSRWDSQSSQSEH